MNSLPDFSENDFFLDLDDIHLGPIIGSGQFSKVYIGRYFGDIVAIKKQTRQTKEIEKFLLRELSVLKHIQHPNLLEYIGASNEVSSIAGHLHAVYIVTPLAECGDLHDLLLRKGENTDSLIPLGWKFRTKICLDASKGLKYLHDQSLVHRDIKTSNFLLTKDWEAKLSDFGMARSIQSGRMTICGTDEYMAPELFFDEEYGPEVDIFSFGMVLIETLSRKTIGEDNFMTRKPMNLFELTGDTIREGIPKDAPFGLIELTAQCCEYEGPSRPNIDEIVETLEEIYNTLPDDIEPIPIVPELPSLPEEEHDNNNNNDNNSIDNKDDDDIDDIKIDTTTTTTNTNNNNNINQDINKTPTSGKKVKALKFPVKAGYLYKRNRHGFRNWKKRWFVLHENMLSWYSKPTDDEARGSIDLTNSIIVRTIGLRWQILNAQDKTNIGDTRLYNRELSAKTKESMIEWLEALEQTIEVTHSMLHTWKRESQTNRHQRKKSSLNQQNFTTINEWLNTINLSCYINNFNEKGYNNMIHLKEMGLNENDLDHLEINIPLHRRVLLLAARSKYRPNIQLAIPSSRDFSGITVYKVVSRYHFSRSVVYLRYSDFTKLNGYLRHALRSNKLLLDQLPKLPGKGFKIIQNQKDPEFIKTRRLALENYLQSTIDIIGGLEPFVNIILDLLELVPKGDFDHLEVNINNDDNINELKLDNNNN